jgi:hypothetical protein
LFTIFTRILAILLSPVFLVRFPLGLLDLLLLATALMDAFHDGRVGTRKGSRIFEIMGKKRGS